MYMVRLFDIPKVYKLSNGMPFVYVSVRTLR